jgi:hypothetical protein
MVVTKVAEHVRVRPGDPHASSFGQGRSRRVAAWRSIRAPQLLSRTGPRMRPADGLVDSPADGWWQWDQHDLGALAAHAQHPVAVLFAQVGGVGPGGFEDPQAEEP